MTDRTIGDTFYMLFTTRAFSTGIPTVLAGTPVVSAYEDGSTTQITAGITLGVSHDSVVGLNLLTIVATTGNGFESGKDYNLVITTGTVDSVSAVGEVIGTFTIELASASPVWDRVLTGATHNIPTSAGRRLRGIQEFQGYEGGAIWVDTLNGESGTTDYENGTVENPVDTWADALTLNTSLGLNKFQMKNGSAITLTSTAANFTMIGESWTLALGGQVITNAYIEGCSEISGVSSGSGFRVVSCLFGATSSWGAGWWVNCRITGAVTLVGTGGHFFQSCFSSTGTVPVIDLTSGVGAQVVCLTPLTGGVQINNMEAGDLVHIEGAGAIVLDSSCTAGTLDYSGDFRFTNNGSGVTVNPGDNTTGIAAMPAAVLTEQMIESYAANGAAPTLTQAMMALHQMLMDFDISGTTCTVKKLDSAATAFVVTLNDAANPTGVTR